MAHIYGKLDVHSRVEAAGRAQRLGVLYVGQRSDRPPRVGADPPYGGCAVHL